MIDQGTFCEAGVGYYNTQYLDQECFTWESVVYYNKQNLDKALPSPTKIVFIDDRVG